MCSKAIDEYKNPIFDEYYGRYYHVAEAVLKNAIKKALSPSEVRSLILEYGFEGTALSVDKDFVKGLRMLERDAKGLYHSVVKSVPLLSPTELEYRWLKTIGLDEKFSLFSDEPVCGEKLEPLYERDMLVYFDRPSRGDDFKDERYISNFRCILSSISEKRMLEIEYEGKDGLSVQTITALPLKLDYSIKDDRFRLVIYRRHAYNYLLLSKIISCRLGQDATGREIDIGLIDDSELVFTLFDEHNALERIMLQLADYKKEVYRLGASNYEVKLYYNKGDEGQIVGRLLSFGPHVKVNSPDSVVKQIAHKISEELKILIGALA